MKTLLEICCPSVETAVIAEQHGTDRIELCTNLKVGGTTPSAKEIRLAKEKLKIPVNVLVRCRDGNFVYDEGELSEMIDEIDFCKQQKIYGVVIGALTNENEIDFTAMKKMIEAAKPMHITFHKAFDEVKNPLEALEQLIELGVDQILTSGQKATATEGIETLKVLNIQANNRITIMAGGSVRSANVLEIVHYTGISAVHSAAGVLDGNEFFIHEVQQLVKLL